MLAKQVESLARKAADARGRASDTSAAEQSKRDEAQAVASHADAEAAVKEAERLFEAWAGRSPERCLTMVRPTVVFGPGNRGNVQVTAGAYTIVVRQGTERSAATTYVVGAERCFTPTGYCVGLDAFWEYFAARGAVDTFGYPVSRPVTLLGCSTQFFQRHVLQRCGTGPVQRLNLLEQALASVQAPRVLAQYLGELKLLLQSRRQEDAVVAQFLALFEPLYESAYARPEGPEGLLLFRAGAWLENMYLAAASGDAAALRRGGQALQGVSALARLNAPRGVLAAFERMQLLLAHQPLIDREISAIRTLVQDIQGLLNA